MTSGYICFWVSETVFWKAVGCRPEAAVRSTGYVRIAPFKASKSGGGGSGPGSCPVLQATLASTGFAQIDDWAAVDGNEATGNGEGV